LLEFGGYPLDVKPLRAYLKKIGRKDIILILDAANSPFTKYKNKNTALMYDYALYSFDMNKILVTGDGGMILSQRSEIIDTIKTAASWGIDNKAKTGYERSLTADQWWETKINNPGINLQM